MSKIIEVIKKGGPLVSAGREQAAEMLICEPELRNQLLSELAGALDSGELGLQRRALKAMQLATEKNSEILTPIKTRLIKEFETSKDWVNLHNLCKVMPYLGLTIEEMEDQLPKLLDLLQDPSRVVIVCAMQCLTDFAVAHRPFKKQVAPQIWELTVSGAGSARSRGKKLMRRLEAL